MPPQWRQIQRIAGFKLDDTRVIQRFAQTREAFEVRCVGTRHGDRRAGGREIERSDVEIGDLLDREQGETTATADHHRQVVRGIEVRGRGHLIAHPQAWLHRSRQACHCMCVGEGRQGFRDQGALQGQPRDRAVHPAVGGQPLQGLGDTDLEMAIVETVDGRVVTDHAPRLGRHVQHVHRHTCVQRCQCLRECTCGAPRRLHQRPVATQATQDPRLRRSHDLRQCEASRIDRLVVGNFGDGFAHSLAMHFM